MKVSVPASIARSVMRRANSTSGLLANSVPFGTDGVWQTGHWRPTLPQVQLTPTNVAATQTLVIPPGSLLVDNPQTSMGHCGLGSIRRRTELHESTGLR
jgi:hypothetical protein